MCSQGLYQPSDYNVAVFTETKDEIKEQQEKLVKVKADKASLEETQKQLKEMKVDKIDLITKNLKLFEAAWNQLGTACVQLKELVQTGKSLVVRVITLLLSKIISPFPVRASPTSPLSSRLLTSSAG